MAEWINRQGSIFLSMSVFLTPLVIDFLFCLNVYRLIFLCSFGVIFQKIDLRSISFGQSPSLILISLSELLLLHLRRWDPNPNLLFFFFLLIIIWLRNDLTPIQKILFKPFGTPLLELNSIQPWNYVSMQSLAFHYQRSLVYTERAAFCLKTQGRVTSWARAANT